MLSDTYLSEIKKEILNKNIIAIIISIINTPKLIAIIILGLSQIVKDELDLAGGEDALRGNVAGGMEGEREIRIETDPG